MSTSGLHVSEPNRFVNRAVRLWAIFAALAITSGITIGRLASTCTTNLKGSVVLGFGFFFFSLLFCRGCAIRLAENRKMNPLLLGFAIPIASVGPLSIGGVVVFGSAYLNVVESEMCGVQFAVGLMYVGGLLWGAIVGVWRRNL